jgi:hypothetical protein
MHTQRTQGLTLALSCLSYDFVGTCVDDSSEDMTTIQVRERAACVSARACSTGLVRECERVLDGPRA